MEKRYGKAIVVFVGYEGGPSLKDNAHQKRGYGVGPTVKFDSAMVLRYGRRWRRALIWKLHDLTTLSTCSL